MAAALVAAVVLVLGPTVSLSAPVAAAVCDNAQLPSPAPTVKVLVMGDSLTQEFEGDYTWRYRFWQAERAQGVNIAFVGPITALMPWWAPGGITGTGDYADPCFNQQQHFATGGKDMAATLDTRTCPFDGQVRTEVACATEAYQPDVVLDFMGYNDLKPAQDGQHGYTAAGLLATVKSFIAQVRTVNATVPVAVANVLSTKAPQIVIDATTYNADLKAALADPSFATGPVGLVDVTKDWKGAPSDTWDGYHPNATGEMHLAWDIAHGLHGLVPAVDPLNIPIPAVPLGPQTPGVVSVSGTASSVHVTWTFPLGSDTELLFERDLTAGTNWTKVQGAAETLDYRGTGLEGHLYEFRVQAARGTVVASTASGAPIYSASVQADLRPLATLARPRVSTVGRRRIKVTWHRTSRATRYEVLIRPAGGHWRTLGWSTSTSLTSPRLTRGRTYAVAVVAWDSYLSGRRSASTRVRVR